MGGEHGGASALLARSGQQTAVPTQSSGVLPVIEVDPETYDVRADGELLVCEPAKVLPMAQRYFLF